MLKRVASSSEYSQVHMYDVTVNKTVNRVLELYEIHTPYIILLETCWADDDTVLIYQFSQGNQHLARIPKERLIDRPQHQHDFIEIMLVLAGHVKNYIEDKVFLYSTGDCCVMNRNILHSEDYSNDFQAVFFMLKNDFVQALQAEAEKQRENPIYHLIEKDEKDNSKFDKVYLDYFPCIDQTKLMQDIRPLLNALVIEAISDDPGANFFTKGYFVRLLDKINSPELYTMQAVRSDSHSKEYLFGKISHIMTSTHGRATRNEISRELVYNGEYLNRVVKQYTGKTITEYGQSIALEEACILLKDTDKSISEIIEELHFTNRSYFYRIFRKQYHETPQEYRDRLRPDIAESEKQAKD